MGNYGWNLAAFIIMFFVICIGIIETPIFYLISLYGSLIIYWTFRISWEDRVFALKNIYIIGVILTVLLLIQRTIFLIVLGRNQNYVEGYTQTTFFKIPQISFILVICVIFIIIPLLVSLLEDLTKLDPEGFVRNPLFVLFLSIVTFGFYQLYWFLLIRKALIQTNIKTIPLIWFITPLLGLFFLIKTITFGWFIMPLFGLLIIYSNFSWALKKRTNIPFLVWFLIFALFPIINISINQAIINYVIIKKE